MLAFRRRFLPLPILALAVTVSAGTACSGGSRSHLERSAAVDSKATVVVGEVTYELRVACYESDANLTAVGIGVDAASGKALKGLIRGPSAAYVGLMFGDDEYIYEADANAVLMIERDGNRLAGDGITFVRDADLDSAEGASVGDGSILVTCVTTRAGSPVSPLPRG